MHENAQLISSEGISSPEFVRRFYLPVAPVRATLRITSLGVYSARINGRRVGDFYLAPGWTVYKKRVQVQEYDVTELIEGENELTVSVGSGWYCGAITRGAMPSDRSLCIIAELELDYFDGFSESIVTDESWLVRESKIRFSDIYLGERYDSNFVAPEEKAVVIKDFDRSRLINQQGEKIVARETILPSRIIRTPKGELVYDFAQELTGIVRITVKSCNTREVRITCAEMLDADGNFYNENYRAASSEIVYVSNGSGEPWEPELTFYGYRYLRIEGVEPDEIELEAIVLSSDIKQVGRLESGLPKLNRLFSNIVWGQKGNFLDVPTDCPQRDERLGWTGDAQVFANTACWQFDVKRFFTKWLDDMKIEQRANGAIPQMVPDSFEANIDLDVKSSAAWADAATVCPWQIYRHYGDIELLRSHFDMMKKWVGYITSVTDEPNLWIGYDKRRGHFGDWLALDAVEGYVGASSTDLIGSAFYYYSTGLVIKAGHALGEDVSEYESLHVRIRDAFRAKFTEYKTQTECVLALYFGLAAEPEKVADRLETLIHERGDTLATGFVGTPYLLYALSETGKCELAYTLLTQEKFPSWLYSVNSGATTIWEHWDGRRPDGSFCAPDMNSFNHYAYGSVAGWVYEVAAGITPLEPGFARVRIEPHPDARLGWLRAEHETVHGKIVSAWYFENGRVRYEITTPVAAVVIIDGRSYEVKPGSYIF